MYDLRDPNWVPPHLRTPEYDPEPEWNPVPVLVGTTGDNVLPFVRQEPVHPETMLRSPQTGMRYTHACAEAAIILMAAAGVAVEDEQSGYRLRADLEGLDEQGLTEAMLAGIAKAVLAAPPVGTVSGQGEPEEAGPPGRPAKYPFATVGVGDTFVVPAGEEQPSYESFRVYCLKRGKALGRKFKLSKGAKDSLIVKREA